jgi:hypothetical protein
MNAVHVRLERNEIMSLKDELLKAKIINKKDLKRIAHEERVEKHALGKKGLEEKKKKEQEELEEKVQQKKQKDMVLAQANKEAQKEKETQARLDQIVKNNRIVEGFSGNRKFYFVSSDGKIPFLLVSDEFAKKLEQGNAIIIELKQNNGIEFSIVNSTIADQFFKILPSSVRFYNKSL